MDHFDVALQSTRRASGPHALMFSAADEVFPVCSPAYLSAERPLHLSELQPCTFLHHSSEPPHLMEWDMLVAGVRSDVGQRRAQRHVSTATR